MAVVHYVGGTITLKGNWTEEMINDVNEIRKSFVYDFYNEDSDIDGHISHEDTASFYINARRGYAAAFDGALYYTDETKKAYDRLCAALMGKEDTYIHISFTETIAYNDDTDEPYEIEHEAKIYLCENEFHEPSDIVPKEIGMDYPKKGDGTFDLKGEIIDIEKYYEKVGDAYERKSADWNEMNDRINAAQEKKLSFT